jgi:hypothetical protein
MPLDINTLQKIYTLLLPQISNETDCRALFILTFGSEHPLLSHITYSGAVSTVLPLMIRQLDHYGRLEDGRPALWALLETCVRTGWSR